RPVWDLYAGHAHGRARIPGIGRRTDGRGDPRGDRRQSLPLHGLHEDHRGDRARGDPLGSRRGSGRRGPDGALTMPIEPPVDSPRTLPDAFAVLSGASPDAPTRPIAGATDLLVQITGEI